jgi:GntR family transcriptional regulator/MocR family aminotransferase
MGVQTVAVPIDKYGMDIESGEHLAPRAALAVVTASQQAPTGVSLSPERRDALLGWASNANAWIIEDDYLAELQLEGRSALALAGQHRAGRVIHIGTFSKTMSPAIGVGFIIAPPLLARRLIDTATWLNAPPNIAVQAALAKFLTEGHYLRHLRRMRELYLARRNILMCGLIKSGISSCIPAALSVLVPLPTGLDDQYIARVVREINLSPAPLSPWYANSSRAKSGLLLNVANVKEASIVENCLKMRGYLGNAATLENASEKHRTAIG